MRPANLKTKIFLDGGDPEETKQTLELLGFLDGQTTNPTLIAKNPEARERLERGEKFSNDEIYGFYKGVVQEVSSLIPEGSVSIEVYADLETKGEAMFEQGKEMFSWIPNAHIKYPSTSEGFKAAEQTIREGMRVNMTLCFQQEQAAAVYASTRGAKKGDVFVSPFIGRLDDLGQNGMDLIANIIKMFGNSDGHAEVLTASVRSYDHMQYALKLGTDIITAPYKAIKEWVDKGMPVPGDEYTYNPGELKEIAYNDIDLTKQWQDFNINHELTVKGIKQFAADWNNLIA